MKDHGLSDIFDLINELLNYEKITTTFAESTGNNTFSDVIHLPSNGMQRPIHACQIIAGAFEG